MSIVPKFEEQSTHLADLVPNPLIILGQDRRILYANPAARALSASPNGQQIEGRKLGEILRCVHSKEPEGCGDTPACLHCGANLAVRIGLGGTPRTDECRITASTPDGDTSLEFSIQSLPMEWKGEKAVFCALIDTSHEKRRRVLERTFFHDILNTVGSVKGLSEILLMQRKDLDGEELAELLKMMHDSCGVMLEEIRSHQLLLAAETGQLAINRNQVAIADCMAEAAMVASHWPAAALKSIVPVYPAGRTTFRTDPVLLGRVLMNLLKNALEATNSGEQVRLCGRLAGGHIEFSVWNAGVIPEAARLQIFQRSFSTKGSGRGIGTYSVRLFAEGFLGGKVSFTSSEGEGTTFTVSIPLDPNVEPGPTIPGGL
jgi:nitrogen-specific signal transduction histidine kinase